MTKSKTLTAVLAGIGLLSASVVSAQQSAEICVEEQEVADAFIFFAPTMMQAFETKCGANLDADGFVAREGTAFTDRFSTLRAQSWPGALNMLSKFASKENADMEQIIAAMPPEASQPFIEALVLQKVSEAITVERCADIERGLEIIAPLPVENMGAMLGFIAQMVDLKNPPLCAYEASAN